MPNRNYNRRTPRQNWFAMYFLNNKVVVFLLTLLLTLLVILTFTLVAPIFRPVLTFINLIAFPLIGAGILYYLFSPLQSKLVYRGVNNHVAIWIIFVLIVLFLAWTAYALIPILRGQGRAFLENLPIYIEQFVSSVENLPFNLDRFILNSRIDEMITSMDLTAINQQFDGVLTSTFGSLGNIIGSLTQFVVGLVTLPVVLYYLLLEGEKIPSIIQYHVPTKYKHVVKRVLYQMNYQIAQFMRGIIIVAVLVGIIFWIGYSLIGLDFAFSLAFLAAIFNVVPYLGSVVSVGPAIIIAWLMSPYMFVKVLIVLAIEQFIESRLIQPYVLGSSLKIHPVTILFVILGAGRIFGVAGVLLAVPTYAVIKVIVKEIYYAFRTSSSLYAEEDKYPYHEESLIYFDDDVPYESQMKRDESDEDNI